MIINLSIFPLGKGEGVGKAVAEAVAVIDKSGLDYQLTAMGTLIEGDWDSVMRVVKKVRDLMARKYSRLYITISIDDRKGKSGRIKYKVASVEKALGRRVRK